MPDRSLWGAVTAVAPDSASTPGVCSQPAPLRVRLERSIRIARSAAEVYSVFAQVARMPQFVQSVVGVDTCGDISFWVAEIEGHRYEWDVEVVQVVPEQVIGWTSYRGPKHSGRFSFLSLGDDTLVFVELNYVPGIKLAHPSGAGSQWNLGDAMDAALHDLKAAIESTHPCPVAVESIAWSDEQEKQATGTWGPL